MGGWTGTAEWMSTVMEALLLAHKHGGEHLQTHTLTDPLIAGHTVRCCVLLFGFILNSDFSPTISSLS